MKKKEKEEERVERIIRGLLKLPENRRCINCNSLGPQYVCTTFLTFVCTNCSGVHREFTHRVKSVSMAKFKAEEVSALQAGGNDRARQIYFKDWDPQRDSYPDGSNLHKLRDFIKHVYVARKYSGERSTERVPRLRLNDKEESYESRKIGLYYSRSKSPNYRDKYERSARSRPGGRSDDRSLKYYYDERRSPCYGEENSRSGGFKKIPVGFEIVDDRIRDEKPRSGKLPDNHRFPHRESRYGSLSPDYQKNMDRSSSPVVRPFKDITGDNAPTLHVGERSKATDRKDADSAAQNQMIKSSGSKGSIDGMAVEDKSQNLIDFDTDCTPSNAVAAPQKEENQQSSDGCNCNSKESSAKQYAPPGPKPNTLEFLLLELSVPSVEPAASVSEESNNDSSPSTTSGGDMLTSGGVLMLTFPDNTGASKNEPGGTVPMGGVSSAAPPGQLLALTSSSDVSATASGDSAPDAVHVEQTLSLLDTFDSRASATSLPLQPSNGGPSQAVPDIHGDSTFKMPNGLQVSNVQQHQLSAIPAADGRPSGQQTSIITTVGGLNNQPQTSMHLPNVQGPSAAAQHSSQDVTNIIQDCTSGLKSQYVPLETKSIGRKELPMNLFTASYSPVPGSIPGWQNALPYGTGYNMQYYPNPVPARQYPNQAISSNPFDLDNETTSLQVSPFAGLTNTSNTGALVPTYSIDTNSSGFMASQAPAYASVTPLWSSSFRSATSSGAYMGQQLLHMNTPSSRPQGDANGFGSEDPFSSLNIIQQSTSAFPLPSARSSLPSMGGNPFV
ncbi:probable ADP-ribosylation factor GTPase-activating protein AGD14 isoform X2 [Jatropha curcas]|uniref:probable ADP-ribosylation factor GTPase-activating protein AGD14 isoform X2 n=1 Tax=Jatropha curcas TaxID=180498 RepID=UPI0009D64582|nr:probable ADP-ribosylation factor GTPase-activating protein AGD14 isoform X2 [Jatropha curcas]